MFIEFKPPLVPEDVIINTELITSIEKSENLDFPKDSPTAEMPVSVGVRFSNSKDVGNLVGVKANYVPPETARTGTFFITIFMRDPLYNKSENNRTFNNAVTLKFNTLEDRNNTYSKLKGKIEVDEIG